MKREKAIDNFLIAFDALKANKLRSGLTALGIIFGVAAVIIMLAIGKGAQKEILDQIKLVGVNNILITPVIQETKSESENTGKEISKRYSPGLTMLDAKSILENISSVEKVSPEIIIESTVIKGSNSIQSHLTGVDVSYFSIFNLELQKGKIFSRSQQERGLPVCVIGSEVKSRLFSKIDPIGQQVKSGNNWLQVIGVLEPRKIAESSKGNLGISSSNNDVFVPVQTVLVRYINRNLITEKDINSANGGQSHGMDEESEPVEKESENKNQLDKIIVQVKNSEQVASTSTVISSMLKRRHSGVEDFEIKVPELLLKQQQRTKDIFNIVLGAIASISLVVGGIGIMNIMLASVLERIREIGIRLAVGATRNDIVFQFLTESVLISITGGVIGIMVGIGGSYIVSNLTGIHTIISFLSIFISFAVSAGVGILFGYMPARKAAEQDPVTSLRYE